MNTILDMYINLWRTVHGCTFSHVLPHQHTDQRAQKRPLLSAAFPHHARTGIKGRPESQHRAVRAGGEPGHTGASHWTDGKEMPLLMGTSTGGYL